MIELNNGEINLPPISKLAALFLVVVIIYGTIRAVFLTGELPLVLPLIAALLSIVALSMPKGQRHSMIGLARIGFHVGLFAYFISVPILSPESVDPSIPGDVHQTIGLMLLLTVVGFEAGYYLRKKKARDTPDADEPFMIDPRQQKWLWFCVYFGMAIWTITWMDYSYAAGVSPIDVLLTMRGAVEGAQENAAPMLGRLAYIFGGGVFLAAAAAALLLTSVERISKFGAFFCWLILLACALLGFLAGTRAIFLYSFSPLVLTFWLRLSRLKRGRHLRWMLIGLAAVVLALTWGAMTAMRGGDIRNYQGGLEAMNPAMYAQGAFDVYSEMAVIVETFPEKINYEYGKSLIPLVFGWVPRSYWPDKPYPFSLYANIIRGHLRGTQSVVEGQRRGPPVSSIKLSRQLKCRMFQRFFRAMNPLINLRHGFGL